MSSKFARPAPCPAAVGRSQAKVLAVVPQGRTNDEQVTIRIFNSLGEEVASKELGRLSAGAHNWTWNESTLPAGSYVYELRAGERLDVGRIQLVK